MVFFGNPKAFVLISDEEIYLVMKKELEKSGFQVEGLLSEISNCTLIVLDHEMFQLDVIDYLNDKRVEKPVLLILTDAEIYSARVQASRIFQDILVLRQHEVADSGRAISALRGEDSLRTLLGRYLPGVYSPMNDGQTKTPDYARLSGAA